VVATTELSATIAAMAVDAGAVVDQRLGELLRLLSQGRWKPPFDPELRSLLAQIYTHLSIVRDCLMQDPVARQRVQQLLATVEPETLGLNAALQLSARLKELLIEFGDDDYLLSSYEEEVAFGRRPNEPVGSISWHSLYGEDVPAGVTAAYEGADMTVAQRASLRSRLLALQRTRWHFYELDRGRASVKGRYMAFLAGLLLVVGAGLIAGIIVSDSDHIWPQVLFTAFAGAVGSSISGAFKLRDQIATIGQLRAFAPALLAQPLVGAAAGLFSLLLLESGVLTINLSGPQWAIRGVVAFAVGFSEPFFLSTVNKVASLAEPSARKS
jgi:hypothetical protein